MYKKQRKPRFKSLRNRATKLLIEDLRIRVSMAYSYKYISYRRMLLLVGILDTFEREAFLPNQYTTTERNQESQDRSSIDND